VIDIGQTAVPDLTYAQYNSLAQAFGFNDINELVTDQINLRQQTQRLSQEVAADREERLNYEVAARFLGEHPEFPNSPEAINALDAVLKSNNVEYTPGNMSLAHAAAVRDGLYAALTQEEIAESMGVPPRTTRPTPPPMIRSGSPDVSAWQSGNHDPQTMPLEELRKKIIREQLAGKDSSLSYR